MVLPRLKVGRKTPVPVVGSTVQPEPLVLVLHDPRRTFPQRTPAPTQPGDQAKAGITPRPRPAAAAALAGCQSFFKGGLLLGIGFLVSSAPGLPLDPMFLEEPPVLLAVLVTGAPFSL